MDMTPNLTRSDRVMIFNTLSEARQEASPLDVTLRYDLRRAVRHVRRRVGLIAACLVIGSFIAATVSTIHKPNYTAAAILSANQMDDDGRNGDTSVDTQIAMLQSQAFIERAFDLLSQDPAFREVLLTPDDLERRLKVSQVMRSRLISIDFTANSSKTAADIANRIARIYVESPRLQGVQSLDNSSDTFNARIIALQTELARIEAEPADAPAGVNASDLRTQIASLKLGESLTRRSEEARQQSLALSPPVQLVALASPPGRPSSLNPIFMIVPAFIFSGIFGVALALFLGSLDQRIYLPSDIVESFTLSGVVGIPDRRRWFRPRSGRSSTRTAGYMRAVDSVLASTLLMQKVLRSTLLLTASEDNDKAFDFALNFATAASRIRSTLLVDMDATKIRKHPICLHSLERKFGVFDVLAGACHVREAICTVPETRLDYMAGGRESAPDALALIAGDRLKHFLAELRPSYDWIVILAPPIVGRSETRLVAGAVDRTILLTRAEVSKFSTVAAALRDLASSMPSGTCDEGLAPVSAVLIDTPARLLPRSFRDKRFVKSSARESDSLPLADAKGRNARRPGGRKPHSTISHSLEDPQP
ncbi:hypothetical protein GCM10007874_08650 [Labrys miyagiensis]|uniref:Polysaccharide chain length determinant N-terminal domain-containing protein n=1 Tax=Labrys miyagiensis TaxID=346912 RepID=A0ABQ6CD39_9HYPH|nr:Wzz/FepE/Etk N-terminal domain-containing protein [Labrys miyagiensis]GLS17850.1 hypothetical protein GCM10007874_08650 [Labrys miyagiensis]